MMLKSISAALRAIARPDHLAATILLAAMLLGGCAITTGHVDLSYEPSGAATKVADANSAKVAVEVSDKRPTQVVGDKMNGYGMKMADIVSDTDVPATVKNAIESELTSRGFTLGSGGSLVGVKLSDLHNQYSMGFLSGEATATMGMEVAVERPEGTIRYKKYITGQYVLTGVQVAGEDNAQKALNEAIKDCISKLFSDTGFVNSLLSSPPAGISPTVPAGS